MLCFLFIPLSYSYEFHDPTMPYIYWENKQKELKAAEKAKQDAAKAAEKAKQDAAKLKAEKESKAAKEKSEKEAKALEKPKLDISMILVSPYSKTAVVNNETVSVGDMVSGVTIVDIREYSITVKKNVMEWTIVWMADIMQDQGQ